MMYDAASKQWSVLPDLVQPRADASIGVLGSTADGDGSEQQKGYGHAISSTAVYEVSTELLTRVSTRRI